MNLKIIIQKLSNLIIQDIQIANIATLNDGDEFLESKSPIILSVVNIEEDIIQKNLSIYNKKTIVKTENTSTIDRYKQPTQYLILSLLFTAYNIDQSQYLQGIQKLKSILQYFQQNKSFYLKKDNSELITFYEYVKLTKDESKSEEVVVEKVEDSYHKITMEFVSLKSEELNQMWSYLGSKYMPSALYKMKLALIQDENEQVTTALIDDVTLKLWENDENDPIGKIEEHQILKINKQP